MSDPYTPTPPPYQVGPTQWMPQAPPPRRRSTGLIVTVMALCTLLVAGAVFVVTYQLTDAKTEPQASRSGTPTPKASRSPLAPPSPSASPTPYVEPSKLPLRAGRTPKAFLELYQGKTFHFSFRDWPFAFEGPAEWGCMGAKSDDAKLADAEFWVCVNETKPVSNMKVNLMLRRCRPTCTAAEITRMNNEWLDEPGKAVRRNSTYYVQNARDGRGLYSLDLSHFFAEKSGGPPVWQVGISVSSPPGTRDQPLMLVNSVLYNAG